MARNVDKIKALQKENDRLQDLFKKELGRYQKKVADQDKEIKMLRGALEAANGGNRQTQTAVDAILTAVTIRYGTVARDPDDETIELGWRLSVPMFSIAEMRRKYEIHARRDEEAGLYVMGVAIREAAAVGDGEEDEE